MASLELPTSFDRTNADIRIFGKPEENIHFTDGQNQFSSHTHNSLPPIPPSGLNELELDELYTWRMYNPQLYSPSIEQLPFLLTHVPHDDPLLGALVWKTSGLGGGFPIVEDGDAGDIKYKLHESRAIAWLELEQLLKIATDIIWNGVKASSHSWGTSINFAGHLRQASASKFTLPRREHPAALGTLLAARDSLMLSAALLSYTIATYRFLHRSTPDGWLALLLKQGIAATTADRIRKSHVARFHSSIRRVGMFVDSSKTERFILTVALFVNSRVPIWMIWSEQAPHRLPLVFQPYTPARRHPGDVAKVAVDQYEHLVDRIGHVNYAMNSFIPPVTINESTIHAIVDFDDFLYLKTTFAMSLWPTLSKAQRKIVHVRRREALRNPLVPIMNSRVFLWAMFNGDWRRMQVKDIEDIAQLWAPGIHMAPHLYDPLRNEYDVNSRLLHSIIMNYIREDFLSSEMSSSTVESMDIPDDSEAEEEMVTYPPLPPHVNLPFDTSAENSSDFRALRWSSIEDTYSHLAIAPSATIATLELIVTNLHGLRLSSHAIDNRAPASTEHDVTKPSWSLVQAIWGCPDVHLNDVDELIARDVSAITPYLTQKRDDHNKFIHDVGLRFISRFRLRPFMPARTANSKEQRWYMVELTGPPEGWYPRLIVYSSIVAHFCLSAPKEVRNVLDLAEYLLRHGVAFSIRVEEEILEAETPAADLEKVALDYVRKRYNAAQQMRFSALDNIAEYITQIPLGWRSNDTQYGLEDFYDYLEAVLQWCHRFPKRAQLALREGGFIWRLVSCFVDPSECLESLPAVSTWRFIMPKNLRIEQGRYMLLGDYLLQEEKDFLAGAYECYRDGCVVSAEFAQMKSWFPRSNFVIDGASDKKCWTMENEHFWNLRVNEILRDGAGPLDTRTWKDWKQGHIMIRKGGNTSVEHTWTTYKQVGAREYMQHTAKICEAQWRAVFDRVFGA